MKATKIEWTEATWNPIRGCSRVSKGCEHCYAEGVARRFAGSGQPYEGLVRLDREGRPKAQWNGTVRFVPEHLADPLRWSRPRMVFVNSMSDLFHERLAFEEIAAVFGVMAGAPQHTFQVLTKRPARAREFFGWYEGSSGAGASAYAAMHEAMARGLDVEPDDDPEWPLSNVWLGVSVEDQRTADERIPVLLSLPAAVRWVSYEPALGAVDFSGEHGGSDWLGDRRDDSPGEVGIDWLVVGGESGPGARPFDVAWARSTVAACREADVPCFVKQLGSYPVVRHPMDPTSFVPAALTHRKGGDMSEWPEDLRVREWPEVTRG